MAKSVRHAIGVLQLISSLYSILFLVQTNVSQKILDTSMPPVTFTMLKALGIILLLFWVVLMLASGGRLFREGRPARGLNTAALCMYIGGIGLILSSMPLYHGVLLTHYGAWMYVLALAPLSSLADIVLPPYRRLPQQTGRTAS